MKKLIIIISLIFVGVCFAGEKEELQWRIKYYQERIAHIKVEFNMIQKDMAIAVAKYKELEKAEKKKKVEKKPETKR